MIEINPDKLPEVKLIKSWEIEGGIMNDLYQVGNWSFETDDEDIKYAEEAIHAWVAWYNHIKNK